MITHNELRGTKVVLFGAGINAGPVVEWLVGNGIELAYFIDNNRDITSYVFTDDTGKEQIYTVHAPDVLLGENKKNLRVIITSRSRNYSVMENQLREMGLDNCVCNLDVVSCDGLDRRFHFFDVFLTFCCHNADSRPRISFGGSAEESVKKFLLERQTIIDELNHKADLVAAKPCVGCRYLYTHKQTFDNYRVKVFHMSIRQAFCQSECIYCYGINNKIYSKEVAEKSALPEKIAKIAGYLQDNNLLDKECLFNFASGEITIMPHKDLLLDIAIGYEACFFTNAFIFNQKIADSLKNNNSSVYVSLDSGTRETFKLVKRSDLFEEVVGNLKKYRKYGGIMLKYVVLPGINDDDKDFNGIIDIMKSLNVNRIIISFDNYLGLRPVYYPVAKFASMLKKVGFSYTFTTNYYKPVLNEFIKKFYNEKLSGCYEQRNNHLREIYRNRYTDDYAAYKEFICVTEIEELIGCFEKGTRFAMLGNSKYCRMGNRRRIIKVFQKLDIPLQSTDLPLEQSYDELKDRADIFVLPVKRLSKEIKSYMASKGGQPRRLLDIEDYQFTYMPANRFLEKNIAAEFLKKD